MPAPTSRPLTLLPTDAAANNRAGKHPGAPEGGPTAMIRTASEPHATIRLPTSRHGQPAATGDLFPMASPGLGSCSAARMAESADAGASKALALRGVRVQVPLRARRRQQARAPGCCSRWHLQLQAGAPFWQRRPDRTYPPRCGSVAPGPGGFGWLADRCRHAPNGAESHCGCRLHAGRAHAGRAHAGRAHAVRAHAVRARM